MIKMMWWLTVAGYLGTAVLCAIAALTNKFSKAQRNTWWGLAVSMFILGINKQQNLTGILTNLGRQYTQQGDWYNSRRPLQLILVSVFLVGGLILLGLLLKYRHAVSRLQWTAVFGVIFLFSFALIRAVSLHAIDAFLFGSLSRIQPNWLVEWFGMALVAVPTTVALARNEKKESRD